MKFAGCLDNLSKEIGGSALIVRTRRHRQGEVWTFHENLTDYRRSVYKVSRESGDTLFFDARGAYERRQREALFSPVLGGRVVGDLVPYVCDVICAGGFHFSVPVGAIYEVEFYPLERHESLLGAALYLFFGYGEGLNQLLFAEIPEAWRVRLESVCSYYSLTTFAE